MASQALLEPRASTDTARVRELLVLWQHPVSRQIVPIGRLGYGDDVFTFDYSVAAAGIEGFRPLPGLGRIEDHYELPELPAVFRQRVMDRERPDFADYVASLGLSPETATPWEQIVESGGERQGDTLQFMEVPAVVDGYARARFLANGVRHIPEGTRIVDGVALRISGEIHERELRELRRDDYVEIVAEDHNDVDPNAVLVTRRRVPLGWVPRFLAQSVRTLLDGGPLRARVVRVNGPESPAHLRLVLELNTPAPAGFDFDPDGRTAAISR